MPSDLPPYEIKSARIFGDDTEHWRIRVGALCRENEELRRRIAELKEKVAELEYLNARKE